MDAIETAYKGYRFRSRTEARWAVFFDALGLFWRYEDEGFKLSDGEVAYLPDFWFPNLKVWAEVKGVDPTDDEDQKARLLAKESGFPVLLLSGPPLHPRYRHSSEGKHFLYQPDGTVERVEAHWLVKGIATRDPEIFAAYGEAMGARFEHGETPRARRLL